MLEVNNLSISYGKQILVDDISFKVQKGKTLVIIGSSGSGKSITATAIMNILPKGVNIISGNILCDGVEIANSRICRKVGIIMQNPTSCFDPVFTIKNHLIESLKNSNLPKTAYSDDSLKIILNDVGLRYDDVIDAYPFQLSGGMLQRVMIALAVSAGIDYLIADEPTSALDMLGQHEILEIIKFIKLKRNLGVIFITHDILVARNFADFLLVMNDGKVIEQGIAKDIFGKPKFEYTKKLIKANTHFYETAWGDMSKVL